MSHWHPRPTAQIGLRLLGLGLILCLEPLGHWLRLLMQQSGDVTPMQCVLGATCFISASMGAMLVTLGPDLWKPVQIGRRWHVHGTGEPERCSMREEWPRTADDACSSPANRPGSQHCLTLERA